MDANLQAHQSHGLGGTEDQEDQEELYQLATRNRVLRPQWAAGRLGWSAERTDRAVRHLTEAMLLQRLPGKENAFEPVAPQAAAFRRLAPLQQQIQRMERRSREIQAELVGFHHAHEEPVGEVPGGQGQLPFGEALRTLAGEHVLHEEISTALSECTGEVLLARPGTQWWAGATQRCAEAAVGVLQRRNVDVRVIHHHATRFDPAIRRFVATLADGGGAARTLAGPFEGVIILDRRTAIVPLEEEHLAVVVQQPGLVRFMVEVFERTWRVAKEFEGQCRTTEVSTLVSDVQSAIIQLLAEGKTDEVIARRIGVSVRTCRNHIAKIYQELGARSRFQLGVMIAKSGLLEQVPTTPRASQPLPVSTSGPAVVPSREREAGAVHSLTAT
ncbi:helix-turn-helix transcriptional regulator [Streptomyces endophyticus]|uniref:LuxR C-terminal-related transcriptional regulator n=1 Tax=Streptomyces endophyticus TaxID=714166 RepID=A0ABU6F878_9ACTN|nr:LuxR C-terminal-related transcriptional regulator [Streptomyces endophyticus]MEB8340239.1 LuxR C-terminal-related transcriptional regulator [Streptomyces endophyticus]